MVISLILDTTELSPWDMEMSKVSSLYSKNKDKFESQTSKLSTAVLAPQSHGAKTRGRPVVQTIVARGAFWKTWCSRCQRKRESRNSGNRGQPGWRQSCYTTWFTQDLQAEWGNNLRKCRWGRLEGTRGQGWELGSLGLFLSFPELGEDKPWKPPLG